MQKALEKMASEPRTERNLSARLRRERPSSRRGVSAPAKAGPARDCANQGGTTAFQSSLIDSGATFFIAFNLYNFTKQAQMPALAAAYFATHLRLNILRLKQSLRHT